MIGIFDSGLGGLIVFREIKKLLPQYSYLYLGDTLRAPYGGRSQEAIYKYTERAISFLFAQGCQLVIIACNTASAEALRKIQQEYLLKNIKDKTKNVLGVVRPVAEEAVAASNTHRVGVVGTRATISSQVYEKELLAINSNVKVFTKACPLLVPLIEENYIHQSATKKILKNYLRELKNKNIDTLILGCTHYPILLKEFQRIMGKKVRVLDPSQIIAQKLKDYLERHPEIETKIERGKERKYLISDLTQSFQAMSRHILDEEIEFQKVKLD